MPAGRLRNAPVLCGGRRVLRRKPETIKARVTVAASIRMHLKDGADVPLENSPLMRPGDTGASAVRTKTLLAHDALPQSRGSIEVVPGGIDTQNTRLNQELSRIESRADTARRTSLRPPNPERRATVLAPSAGSPECITNRRAVFRHPIAPELKEIIHPMHVHLRANEYSAFHIKP